MRIEILRQVMISGEPVSAGSFVEVSEADGNLLVGSGKAVVAPAVEKPAPVEVTEEPKPAPAPVKPAKRAKTVTSEFPTKD
jgi:hypothetical protein